MKETKNNFEVSDKVSYAPYPARTLSACIEMAKKISAHGGTFSPVSLKEICVILEMAEPSLQYPLTSAQQYQLIDRRENGYQLTELFEQIDATPSDRNLLIKAFKNPFMYSTLIDEMNGKILPSKASLIDYIKKQFKMLPNSADRAASVFLKNLEELNLVDNNRLKVLVAAAPVRQSTPNIESAKQENEKVSPEESRRERREDKGLFELPIPLRDNNIAYLVYPKDSITKRDLAVIKLQIGVIEATLKDADEKIEGG